MPKRYAYNTSATQVKKRYAMIGSTATQVKKRYAMIGSTATLVYSAELQAVVNSKLQSGVTLTNVANGSSTSSTSGTAVTTTAYAGAYFGYNVSRFNTDIREYGSVTIEITTSGDTFSGGNYGYVPCYLFVGTASQIAGVKFTAYNTINYNGCTTIGGWLNDNKTETITVDLSSYQSKSSAIYIGCIVGEYNGGNKTMTFNTVIYT